MWGARGGGGMRTETLPFVPLGKKNIKKITSLATVVHGIFIFTGLFKYEKTKIVFFFFSQED